MKKVMIIAAAMALSASMTFAGGMAVAVDEAAPVAVEATDWTGAYAGVALGYSDVTLSYKNQEFSEDNVSGNVFAGYRHDFGPTVFGAEVEYNDVTFGGEFGVKAMMGFDAGKVLPYIVVGYNRVEDVSFQSYGLGVDYKLNESILVGAEYLRSESTVYGLGVDTDSLAIRLSHRF